MTITGTRDKDQNTTMIRDVDHFIVTDLKRRSLNVILQYCIEMKATKELKCHCGILFLCPSFKRWAIQAFHLQQILLFSYAFVGDMKYVYRSKLYKVQTLYSLLEGLKKVQRISFSPVLRSVFCSH